MKKVIFVLLISLLVFAGCTRVISPPDVEGTWKVSAIVSGVFHEFDIDVVVEGMFFTDLNDNVQNGALSNKGMIYFEYLENSFFGNVATDYIDGFVRKGTAGDIIGNWSAVRLP